MKISLAFKTQQVSEMNTSFSTIGKTVFKMVKKGFIAYRILNTSALNAKK
jgi:hypothetical protein